MIFFYKFLTGKVFITGRKVANVTTKNVKFICSKNSIIQLKDKLGEIFNT